MQLLPLPEEHMIDQYTALAHRALQAAERLYPGGRYYVAGGNMGEVPVLCELADGDILIVHYYGD